MAAGSFLIRQEKIKEGILGHYEERKNNWFLKMGKYNILLLLSFLNYVCQLKKNYTVKCI